MSLTIETPTVHVLLKGMATGGKGYGISHSWEGTVLTVTSDSGSSSADLVGPAGAESFAVHITRNADGSGTADKTFAETAAVIERGQQVAAIWQTDTGASYVLPLLSYEEGLAVFSLGMDALFNNHWNIFVCFGADESVIWSEGTEHYLPAVSESDNGKLLTVTDGRWQAAEVEVPQAVSVTAVKSDNSVTVTATYDDGSNEVTTITLDDNGDPVTVTKDGKDCALTWEGFE